MNTITLPALFDAHCHLRQGEMTERVAPWSGRCCDGVIAMPNTKPPLHDPDHIEEARFHYQKHLGPDCKVHMTAKWLERTTPADVIAAKKAGVVGFKLYPQGATTNAEDGIPFDRFAHPDARITAVLAEMERQELVLLCHGEAPGFVLDRELVFLDAFCRTSNRFPALRMTLEHISTFVGLYTIRELHAIERPVLGTITLHHMMTTLDDVIGGKLQPDLFCMPIPKRDSDRLALLNAALSGEDCFALGSDSAPHEPTAKYCPSGCAGVFTAPVLAESLAELFDGGTDCLEKFAVRNAMKFYDLEHSGRTITLVREDHQAPVTAGGVVCFRGGQTLKWKLID